MNGLQANEFNQRPIVAVEDHVYHISELLRHLNQLQSSLLEDLTVVCLDRAGPDTDAAVTEWISTYPRLQVAARAPAVIDDPNFKKRLFVLPEQMFKDQNEYCRQIAAMIRPQGMLLQDIELETLEFVPRDRWWESTMLASTVRGIVGQRPPRCAFISNKRGYEATFGAELLAAGHDPRDVLNKYETEQVVIPFLKRYLDTTFSQTLRWRGSEGSTNLAATEGTGVQVCRITDAIEERDWVESQVDVLLWPERDRSCEVGGRAVVSSSKKPRLSLPIDSNELETWTQLIDARLEGGDGVEVVSVGERVAPAGALRAEVTNAAARHLHSLRKRLVDPQDIVTVAGRYRLRDGLTVGRVDNVRFGGLDR